MIGALGYIHATLKGTVRPNRITWGLWAFEGVAGFMVEVSSKVGAAAYITLMFGILPALVVAASFFGKSGVWKMGVFDWLCGAVAASGVVVWMLVNSATLSLVIFVGANTLAGLPTLVKAWRAPKSESLAPSVTGVGYCIITLLTLHQLTTAGALFPGSILVFDAAMVVTLTWARRREASRVRTP